MNQHPLVATLVSIALVSSPAWAQGGADDQATVHSSPGKATMARTRTVVATVTEVDAAARKVSLKGPAGNVLDLELGPDVRNLEQLKTGDRVRVRYQESLTLTLKKSSSEPPGVAGSADVTRSEPGQLPGGEVNGKVEITANVVSMNPARQMVTLRGPNQTVDLHVADREQFRNIKVGDQVHVVYTQAMAVSVDRLARAK